MVKVRPGSRKGRTKIGTGAKKAARREAVRQKHGVASRRAIVHHAMRDSWDNRYSPAKNLAGVGLRSSVNNLGHLSAGGGSLVKVAPIPTSFGDCHVLKKLEEEARLPESSRNQVIHSGERLALHKLTCKYGDDWERMSRDLKLNYLQWTPRQLEKKVLRMRRILEGS